MGTRKNTISINGRLYDATTGKTIDGIKIVSPKTSVAPRKSQDVFAVKVRPAESSPSERIKVNFVRSSGVSSITVHHKTARAKTLMRSAVKNPSGRVKPATISGLIQQSEPIIIRGNISERARRASLASKNHKVAKFAATSAQLTKKIEHIPVITQKTVEREPEIPMAEQSVYALRQAPPLYNKQSKQADNIFEVALKGSNSHHQSANENKPHRSKSRSLGRLASSAAIVLLMIGFFAYHNATGMALRSASSKAGFSAGLPKYKPVGFKLNNSIAAEPGKIVLSYKSNSGGNGFSLTQKKSDMSTEKLVSEFLSSKSQSASVKTSSGKTVFIYNESNATWLDKGVWYNLSGNAQISQDQLIRIASTL